MGNPPWIIAHRGASKYAPENTLPALQKAIDLGVDAVEIDIQLTQDKVPVVFHNDDLLPFTTTYQFIHGTPLRSLKTVDVGSHFGTAFRGERIPTLEEALTLLAPTNLCINLELKPQPFWHFGLEERTVQLVRRLGLTDRVFISSFSPLILFRLRWLAPELPRGLLMGPQAFLFLQAKIFGKFGGIRNLHPFAGALSPALGELVRTQGWGLYVWTVNTREAITRAIDAKADGLITDDPVLAREIVSESHHGI